MADEPNTAPTQNPQLVKKSKWYLWLILGVIILGLVAGTYIFFSEIIKEDIDFENIPEITSLSSCKVLVDAIKTSITRSCDIEDLVEANRQLMEKSEKLTSLNREDQEKCTGYFEEIYLLQIETCGEDSIRQVGAIIVDEMITSIDEQLGSSTSCFDAAATMIITTSPNTFVNPETNEASIEVRRGISGEFVLLGLKITFNKEGNTITKTWTEDLPEKDGTVIQVFSGTDFDYGTVGAASITAVVQDGDTEKTCDLSYTLPLPQKL